MSMKVNRRSFIGIGAAFAAAGCQSQKAQKGCPAITSTRSPNSLVRHLSIGCGNRAWGDVKELCTHPSVEMAAFCDVDSEFLSRAKNTFPKARFSPFRRRRQESPHGAFTGSRQRSSKRSYTPARFTAGQAVRSASSTVPRRPI